MQVTETSSEGLKRKLKVVVGAAELGERFAARIDEVKDKVQLKGFRKGKVPLAHIRKLYGKGLMTEVVQETIRDTSTQAIKERKERAAQFPDISLVEGGDGIEGVLDGKADLAYEMSFEVLPEIKITDLTKLSLEKLVAEPDETAISKAMDTLAERNTGYEAEDGRAAAMGDRVTINYDGKIAGERFEGGMGEGLSLVLGSANFIPGFEEGLVGVKAGEKREVTGTFPEAYPVKELAGKEATFSCDVTAVEKPVKPLIDDEFAKGLGVESLDKLKELVVKQIQGEYEGAARAKLKRELLDVLDKVHTFELPASLVTREFDAVWQQLQRTLQSEGKTLADEGRSEDEVKEEYRKIAERRVRLGLVVGEIGDKARIEVTQDELRRALMEQARRFPGREKNVYEYFEKTPGALQELRAPIFEDKVVDHILTIVKPTEVKVTADELKEKVEAVTQG